MASLLEDGQLLQVPYLPGKEPTPVDLGAVEDNSTTEFNVPSDNQQVNPDETNTDEQNINTDEGDLVDINTATVEELDTLPGIGPTTAQKIIDYREENGPFFSIEEIMNVSGIGPSTFEEIQDLITVGEVE
jgi:comEA protein